MEHIIINFTQVVIAGALAILSIKFWKRNLNNKFKLDTNNLAYTIFSMAQIIGVITIVFLSINDQILAYLESFSLIGENAAGLWSFVGIQLLTSILLYVIVNLISHLIFTLIHTTDNGLYAEIEGNNWYSIFIYATTFIGLTIIASSFVLAPLLLEWISNDASLIPLY